MVQSLRKIVSTKLNILLNILICDPAIPLFGIYPKDLKSFPHKNLHVGVYSSFIHDCQKLEVTERYCSR